MPKKYLVIWICVLSIGLYWFIWLEH